MSTSDEIFITNEIPGGWVCQINETELTPVSGRHERLAQWGRPSTEFLMSVCACTCLQLGVANEVCMWWNHTTHLLKTQLENSIH